MATKKTLKKKYIIVRAFTNSEWDGVNFGLIEITSDFQHRLKWCIAKQAELAIGGINEISCSVDAIEFFTNEWELPKRITKKLALSNNDDDAIVIELTDAELLSLSTPEQTMGHGKVTIGSYIKFSCTAKHTDEEYWGDVNSEFILGLNLGGK